MVKFDEKPKKGQTWINGGFFVLETGIFKYIKGDDMPWEEDPLKTITNENNFYKHHNFGNQWIPLGNRTILEDLHSSNKAPWVTW